MLGRVNRLTQDGLGSAWCWTERLYGEFLGARIGALAYVGAHEYGASATPVEPMPWCDDFDVFHLKAFIYLILRNLKVSHILTTPLWHVSGSCTTQHGISTELFSNSLIEA